MVDTMTTTASGWWPLTLEITARVLASLLFVFFGILLWQTIEIGSANGSFQRVSVQIASMEPSVVKLEGDRRVAEVRVIRIDSGVAPGDEPSTSAAEARQALVNAATDYGTAARRYYLAVCDAGDRLSAIGFLPRLFMPARQSSLRCPALTFDLKPGEFAKNESPEQVFHTVRVELEHYSLLANSYVLPILFGMLGALVFALRDMVGNPKNMSELPIVVGYILRILLGAIFGLIIGYVNVSLAMPSGVSASPLLLSLVAGFATDAVISLLERISLAFSYDRNSTKSG